MEKTEIIKARSTLYYKIRKFFIKRDFLEVETPILSPTAIPESSINLFRSEFDTVYKGKKECFLLPSPERWMKPLIRELQTDIFQLSRCFRNKEQWGPHHNPEFTILEWYKLNIDYVENITLLESLISSLLPENAPESIRPPFRRMTMENAFKKYAGFSLIENSKKSDLYEQTRRLGLPLDNKETSESLFNKIFLTFIEPELPMDRPLVLMDYPSFIPTTAAPLRDTPYSQRWELYINGVEIANCYTEESDYHALKETLNRETEDKKKLGDPVICTEDLVKDISQGLPPCSGGALGVDRLLMIILQQETLDKVIYFPLNKIMKLPER